jgi:hypothetical protein
MFMPLFSLLLLLVLLMFLNAKLASILYAVINLSAIFYLLIKNTMESHDLMDALFLSDSRFSYVIITGIRSLINNETIFANVLIYGIVFAGYYFLIFQGACLLVKKLQQRKESRLPG